MFIGPIRRLREFMDTCPLSLESFTASSMLAKGTLHVSIPQTAALQISTDDITRIVKRRVTPNTAIMVLKFKTIAQEALIDLDRLECDEKAWVTRIVVMLTTFAMTGPYTPCTEVETKVPNQICEPPEVYGIASAAARNLYHAIRVMPRTLETSMAVAMLYYGTFDIPLPRLIRQQSKVTDVLRTQTDVLSNCTAVNVSRIKTLAYKAIATADRAGAYYQAFIIRIAAMLAVHALTGMSTPCFRTEQIDNAYLVEQ